MKFPGTFVSAGILPDIKYDLTIQPDYSLGFIKEAPTEGYALYRGKGKGFGKYLLSNKGLHGNGKTDYLVSHTTSQDFVFFPDSMNTNADVFNIPEIAGGLYPPVDGKSVYNHWLPYADSMFVFKRKEPIQIYKDKVIFQGSFVLTPVELVGKGITNYQNIQLQSQNFAFKPDNIITKDGNLIIKSDASKKYALMTNGVNANLDLKKDFAKFNTNSDTTKVKLPSQQFSTTLNSFTYDLKEKEINFERTASQNEKDAYFKSDNPTQENLQFTSAKARYKLDSLNLKAFEVPELEIADAKIATNDRSITVQKEGVIKTIVDAVIIANATNRYHRIHHATVNIFSKNKYTGFGTYNYVDKNDDSIKILFNDIHTTEDNTTEAVATIRDTQHFHVWPKILFKGAVTLESEEKNLWFNGSIMPEHSYPQLRTAWVKTSDTIDAKNVLYDFPKAFGEDNKELFTGTYLNNRDGKWKMYSLLFGKKIHPTDREVFSTSGLFTYDEKQKLFILGERRKLIPPTTEIPMFVGGNTFQLQEQDGEVYTEGEYKFGGKFGKKVEIKSAGSFTQRLTDNKHNFNVAMIVNFPWNDDITKLISDNILMTSYTMGEITGITPATYNAFVLMMKEKKDREKIINELSSYKYIASADAANRMFVFSSVNMVFSDSAGGFFSEGPIGLATIKKAPINKSLNGMIAVKQTETQSTFGMLLETLNENYHYFKFVNRTLYYLGNEMAYVDKIKEIQGKLEKNSKGSFSLEQETVDGVMKFKAKDLDMFFSNDPKKEKLGGVKSDDTEEEYDENGDPIKKKVEPKKEEEIKTEEKKEEPKKIEEKKEEMVKDSTTTEVPKETNKERKKREKEEKKKAEEEAKKKADEEKKAADLNKEEDKKTEDKKVEEKKEETVKDSTTTEAPKETAKEKKKREKEEKKKADEEAKKLMDEEKKAADLKKEEEKKAAELKKEEEKKTEEKKDNAVETDGKKDETIKDDSKKEEPKVETKQERKKREKEEKKKAEEEKKKADEKDDGE
ncbi:MAG: hypothetical protein NTX03_10940 [Bacteroidetes bacterium]|nr:hypothetical protein [Bacteroidota bacterium]